MYFSVISKGEEEKRTNKRRGEADEILSMKRRQGFVKEVKLRLNKRKYSVDHSLIDVLTLTISFKISIMKNNLSTSI